MMTYVYYYDCEYYTVLATTVEAADRAFNKLTGANAAQSAIITSVREAA